MKSFVILALCAATVAANNYGQSAPITIRVEKNSYSAPQEMRTDSYGSSYSSRSSYGGETRNQISITRFNHEIRGSESDSVSYETGNGISMSDNTQVVNGRDSSYDDGYGKMVKSDSSLSKNGAFSYTSPEGQHISTTWHADENGFRAEGAHLPRPVEMPAEHAEAHRLALSRSSSSYGGNSYESSPMRSSYEAPSQMRSSYEAPAIRVQSYDAPAPARNSY